MSANVGQRAQILREHLSIEAKDLDEDLSIALTSLITTAVHDDEPRHNLNSISKAVKESGSAFDLEPLTVIPIVVRSVDEGTDTLMDLMATECSAKEMVMAIEEVVEALDRRLQSTDEEEDDDDDARHASTPRQIARLIQAYATSIPRLAQWKKSPKQAVESRLTELQSLITLVGGDATVAEGQSIITSVSQLVLSLSQGADTDTKALMRSLVESTLVTFPNHIHGNLARAAFTTNFRRLIIPQAEPATSSRQDVLDAALSSICLDEILSILINFLAPLRSVIPRPELEVDLIIPLIHLLPPLASNHPDPDIRHYTFRVLSLVLGLSPSPVRFQLLKDLLSDEDTPPQMRTAAVGLLKEAVMEGLSQDAQNMFASPLLLSTFGPIVLQPDPPDIFDSATCEDFLAGPEPLRLVECLGFYYVWLQRDRTNRVSLLVP
ncbi:hypothetical protein TRAPUB_7757 [Trametes pubescens]|uniref:Uncharacterized protein n=1 Tax=Trametes pubescens TaxID=154538 RepID=A0A1M2V281_TRAPU|nr:hypothetical protein TRAPUB_7757 [Trametes pubescens]